MKGNTEDRGYNVTAYSSTRTIPLLKRTDLSCLSFGLLRPDIARYCGNKLGPPEVVLCDSFGPYR